MAQHPLRVCHLEAGGLGVSPGSATDQLPGPRFPGPLVGERSLLSKAQLQVSLTPGVSPDTAGLKSGPLGAAAAPPQFTLQLGRVSPQEGEGQGEREEGGGTGWWLDRQPELARQAPQEHVTPSHLCLESHSSTCLSLHLLLEEMDRDGR